MNYKEFSELVFSRQACREFSSAKVDKETVLKIAELSRFTPSACNSQPWKMYCVTNERKVKEVTCALQDDNRNQFLSNVSAYIAVSEKATPLKADVERKFSQDFFVKYDIGELLAYITLSAKSLGVENIIIGYVNKQKIRKALSLTDGEECNIVIALGYSTIPIREKSRRDKNETIVEI